MSGINNTAENNNSGIGVITVSAIERLLIIKHIETLARLIIDITFCLLMYIEIL